MNSENLTAGELANWGRALARITEEAATVILPFWRTELDVAQKADESPVTEADRASDGLFSQMDLFNTLLRLGGAARRAGECQRPAAAATHQLPAAVCGLELG